MLAQGQMSLEYSSRQTEDFFIGVQVVIYTKLINMVKNSLQFTANMNLKTSALAFRPNSKRSSV